MALWVQAHDGLLARLDAELKRRSAHPARTVVLLPYAQLRPLATRLWAQCYPDGFTPRFETTMNWTNALGDHVRQSLDITFDAGLDTLTAQALLAMAGLASHQDALAGLLVQSAHQLAPLAAAAGPAGRMQWAVTARTAAMSGMDGAALQWEAAVARIAVEWASVSGYASDLLFAPRAQEAVDCLVMVQGLSPDPLAAGLADVWADRLQVLSLAETSLSPQRYAVLPPSGAVRLHVCLDAEDEAQRSAACALRHIALGNFPVALVSSDRALTRRVRAMLDSAGVQMRDENGWKLSTSRAAANVMALLRAATWNAPSDAVLDWLKTSVAWVDAVDAVDALEKALRRGQVRDWSDAVTTPLIAQSAELLQTCTRIDALRETFKGRRLLVGWLEVLRGALQASGVWDGLLADGAGAKVAQALHLENVVQGSNEGWNGLAATALWAARRMDLREFTAWVNQALEGASFQPDYPAEEQVVILPMSQMLGRPFAAVVLAGCDEVRLNPGAEPPGAWTAAQRAALGLPARDALDALTRSAWERALQTPVCDVLWRTSDEAGEALLPSTLVQLLMLDRAAQGVITWAEDPRELRVQACTPVAMPQPVGRDVPVSQLSASAYEDLRQCPYRFFALRQLGLKMDDELESEVDKRDFGLWLHAVLSGFHDALLANPTQDASSRKAMLDASADEATRAMALPQGEFLPFAAAWPAVRDGYLQWLGEHEAKGAHFVVGESPRSQQIGSVKLVGRIDRIDRIDSALQGETMLLDYKTEPLAKSRARVKDMLEDTQIAFYAALLPNDTLRAAYVNVGERDGTVLCEQPHVVHARDALIHGILEDMEHIAQGAALPALGDGTACDYCQARGLCRKDFWTVL